MRKKISALDPVFRMILRAVSTLAQQQHSKAYLVGGVVRDLILGKTVFDLDIVVEGDAIELCRSLTEHLGGEFVKHHNFKTATFYYRNRKIDFATSRKETYASWGTLPEVSPSCLQEDLFRRDFTINAMALSINQDTYGALIDFYDGALDLKKRLIRILHTQSFLDDPTRIIRALRFEQRLGFRIERNTLRCLHEALERKAIDRVHPHRLRDEAIVLLKEPKAYACIQRLQKITGLCFLSSHLRSHPPGRFLLKNIARALTLYQNKFNTITIVPRVLSTRIEQRDRLHAQGTGSQSIHRALDGWLVYLMAIVEKLSLRQLKNFVDAYGFRKGERIRLLSLRQHARIAKQLKKKLRPHRIYELLHPLSYETMIFMYAFYDHRSVRDNIMSYLKDLWGVRLSIKGHDLQHAGIEPVNVYSKIFEKLLFMKLDGLLRNKDQELQAAKKIARRISHNCY